jgi:hypothetical protein
MKKSEMTPVETYAEGKRIEREMDQFLAENKDKGLIGAVKVDIGRAVIWTTRGAVRAACKFTMWQIQKERARELANAPKALPVYVDSISLN